MSNQSGFTLVELLVAMVAASLLLLGLAVVNGNLATRLANVSDKDDEASITAASRVVAQLVEQATAGSSDLPLEVAQNRIAFPVRGPSADAALAVLTVTGAAGNQNLLLDLRRRDRTVIAASQQALLSNMQAITLEAATIGTAGNDASISMLDITMTRRNGDVRHIAATPRITARPGCRFDPISMACRPE